MKLKWYGQACFLITADNGLKIVTDPYTPETSGYVPVTEAADIVIRSSDNDSFHCRADLIPATPSSSPRSMSPATAAPALKKASALMRLKQWKRSTTAITTPTRTACTASPSMA